MFPSLIAFIAAVTLSSCVADKIDNLANSIKTGLLHSPVLGKSARFTFVQPHDMFARISTRLMTRAGMFDPAIIQQPIEMVAAAGDTVGKIPSCLFFKTIGYEVAKYLDSIGQVTDGNVDALSKMFVSYVEQAAIANGGVSDPESVGNAVVDALYNLTATYGLANNENILKLFYLFPTELLTQSGKILSPEVLLKLQGLVSLIPPVQVSPLASLNSPSKGLISINV